jgi:hypothetical protein
MSHKPKRYNGLKHRNVLRARGRILREAQKKGFVTNARAKQVSKFSQVWFHLQAMADAGHLEHVGYNHWRPAKRKGRPPKTSPYEIGPSR